MIQKVPDQKTNWKLSKIRVTVSVEENRLWRLFVLGMSLWKTSRSAYGNTEERFSLNGIFKYNPIERMFLKR